MAKIPKPLSGLADILELGIGLIIWVAYKGRGVWKTITVLHKMPLYMLIYYKIFLNVYLSIVHSLLFSADLTLYSEKNGLLLIQTFFCWIILTKILLVPPKYEIIMVLSNYSFFNIIIAILELSLMSIYCS